jgi:hypothetical protein
MTGELSPRRQLRRPRIGTVNAMYESYFAPQIAARNRWTETLSPVELPARRRQCPLRGFLPGPGRRARLSVRLGVPRRDLLRHAARP